MSQDGGRYHPTPNHKANQPYARPPTLQEVSDREANERWKSLSPHKSSQRSVWHSEAQAPQNPSSYSNTTNEQTDPAPENEKADSTPSASEDDWTIVEPFSPSTSTTYSHAPIDSEDTLCVHDYREHRGNLEVGWGKWKKKVGQYEVRTWREHELKERQQDGGIGRREGEDGERGDQDGTWREDDQKT